MALVPSLFLLPPLPSSYSPPIATHIYSIAHNPSTGGMAYVVGGGGMHEWGICPMLDKSSAKGGNATETIAYIIIHTTTIP